MDREIYDIETPLTNEIEKHIKKLIKPLKEEEELKKILKVKLTKKEFKILTSWANNDKKEVLFEKLNLDEKRYKEISLKLTKKLNQEKLKQEIMI